jgi:hypothetical protein
MGAPVWMALMRTAELPWRSGALRPVAGTTSSVTVPVQRNARSLRQLESSYPVRSDVPAIGRNGAAEFVSPALLIGGNLAEKRLQAISSRFHIFGRRDGWAR